MNARHIALTIAAMMLLTVPLGAAEWRGRGFYEPDTAQDVAGGFMYNDPDTGTTGAKVYFSAFPAYYVLSPNHNSAALGTQAAPYPTNLHAVLGVWKDCNKDGYIGTPEGLFTEYLSALLLDTSVCPPTPTVDHADESFTPVHNDGQWVREFLAIGPDFVAGAPGTEDDQGPEHVNNTNHFNLADESARIWGDWGLPEDETKASCPVNPRPTGTYQSTGGFLRYADCFSNWRVTGQWNDVAHLAGQPGLAFDDAAKERPDQSATPLNQPNPWGQEGDASYVSAFDCSQPITYHDNDGVTHQVVTDPRDGSAVLYVNATDENYDRFVMGTPGAPSINPGGSAAGTVNETGEGAGYAWNWASFAFDFVWGDGATADEGNCDRDDDDGGVMSGQIYEAEEVPFEGTTLQRTQTDVYYNFDEGPNTGTLARSDEPICVEDEPSGIDECRDAPWRGWPSDGGQAITQTTLAAASRGTWFGNPGYAVSRNPYVNRDDLSPWGGVYYTAYAWVDTAAIGATVAGATGVYGSPHCTSAGTPITGAFNCDPDAWWRNSDGTSLQTDWQVLPGKLYNLRDIDCWDASNRVTGGAVHTGLIGARTCARP